MSLDVGGVPAGRALRATCRGSRGPRTRSTRPAGTPRQATDRSARRSRRCGGTWSSRTVRRSRTCTSRSSTRPRTIAAIASAEARGALVAIDDGLADLAARLDGRARMVVTSDHGHAFVPEQQRHRLRATDQLASLLRAMPSGDMRAPSFHVLPDRLEEFEAGFRARYGQAFVLLTPPEVEDAAAARARSR